MTQEVPREHLFGFKYKLIVIEYMEVPKSPEMVKKTDRRGILRYGDLIDTWPEGNIYIDKDKLPTPENITVPEAGA